MQKVDAVVGESGQEGEDAGFAGEDERDRHAGEGDEAEAVRVLEQLQASEKYI